MADTQVENFNWDQADTKGFGEDYSEDEKARRSVCNDE